MFKNIIEKLNKAERVGIFTHVNPDGDALGSSYSLKKVLTNMGKCAEVYLCGSIEPCVCELVGADNPPAFASEDCDLLVAVDCADLARLDEWSGMFEKHQNTIAIDHHITHKKFANETVVLDISSNCEIMYMLYKEMGTALDLETATDLYIGIVTDTGGLKFESVTGDTYRIVAELVELGVPFSDITKKLFNTVSLEYLKLKSRAIDRIKLLCGGMAAMLILTDEDFAECGTDEAEASPIVSLPGSIKGVEVGIYIRRRGDDFKVSLRSVKRVDVSKIASYFGGGGHIRAAGYSVKSDELNSNIEELTAKIREQL